MTGATPVRRRIRVRGVVQGVGYRYATVRQARKLGLAGWVRNCPDGSVEILAEGPPDAVRELEAWCWRGPALAEVTSVESEPCGTAEGLRGFDIRY